jgi:hypothetical protein
MAADDNKQRQRAIHKIERVVLGSGKILWSCVPTHSLVAGCYYTDVRGEARMAISIKSDARRELGNNRLLLPPLCHALCLCARASKTRERWIKRRRLPILSLPCISLRALSKQQLVLQSKYHFAHTHILSDARVP